MINDIDSLLKSVEKIQNSKPNLILQISANKCI